jgi:hypothetical protein
MRFVYCSECGKKIEVMRKALPKFGAIIDIIEPHECSEEPIELDLKQTAIPTFDTSPKKGKFVQKLNDLSPSKVNQGIVGSISSEDLRDRRFESEEKKVEKSTAPKSVLEMIKEFDNTSSDATIEEDPGSEE